MKDKVLIALTAGVMVGGLVKAYSPPSPDPDVRRSQQMQQQVDELSEAQQREHERMREAGRAHGEAERERRDTPGERRRSDARPRIRLR